MTEQAPARTYVIGPLERRGLLLGLRLGHLLLLGVGGAGVIAIVNVAPNAVGLAACVVFTGLCAVAALLPVGGRGVDEWAAVAGRHGVARLAGTTRWVSDEAVRGIPLPPADAEVSDPPFAVIDAHGDECWVSSVWRADRRRSTPPTLRGVEVWAARWGEAEMGVVRDRVLGRWTAVLAVRGRPVALCDRAAKEARIDDWARVLSALAREANPLVRMQWIERAVPDDSGSVRRDFESLPALDPDAPPARSYRTLLDRAGPSTQQHLLHLALTLGERQAAPAMRRLHQRGELAACEVLAHEAAGVVQLLAEAGLEAPYVLGVRNVAELLRAAHDPGADQELEDRAATRPDVAGAAPGDAFPQALDEGWGEVRIDGGWHRTYWVSEWPRVEVGPDLMVPLLLRTACRRSVSVVFAVDSPSRAMRRAQSQRHGDESTERARERLGFTSGARRQREQEGAIRREAELASGHAQVRFSAYITVSGRTEGELEEGCADVERQARAAGLEVRPEYGVQADAFTFTLPLGRGLR